MIFFNFQKVGGASLALVITGPVGGLIKEYEHFADQRLYLYGYTKLRIIVSSANVSGVKVDTFSNPDCYGLCHLKDTPVYIKTLLRGIMKNGLHGVDLMVNWNSHLSLHKTQSY